MTVQSSRRGARRTLRLSLALAATGGMALAASSGISYAATSTQSMTATTGAGVLSITAPSTLALGTVTVGSTVAATPLGSLAWTDTLNDSTASSVTLQARDLCPAGCSASNNIGFSNDTITANSTAITAGACNNTGSLPTAGAGGTLSGTDTTPGTTYSTAVTLANGSTTSEGCWTEGNSIGVTIPANATPSTSFTATLQYTLTG